MCLYTSSADNKTSILPPAIEKHTIFAILIEYVAHKPAFHEIHEAGPVWRIAAKHPFLVFVNLADHLAMPSAVPSCARITVKRQHFLLGGKVIARVIDQRVEGVGKRFAPGIA